MSAIDGFSLLLSVSAVLAAGESGGKSGSDTADDPRAARVEIVDAVTTMSRGEWRKQLEGWRDAIRAGFGKDDDPRVKEGMERIAAIRDPAAVPALEVMATDGREHWRKVFLEPLGKIGGRQAVAALVRLAIFDNNVQVREAAAEAIRAMPNRKDATAEFLKYLRADRYSAAAAAALSRAGLTERQSMADELDPDLTYGLINALIYEATKEEPVVVWRYAYGGNIWGGLHQEYEQRLVRVKVPIAIQNAKALTALKEYTGQDYGYDEEKWRFWYQRLVSRRN